MKRLNILFSCFFFALTALAQDIQITHGPYLCDMTSDGVTIVWTTNKPALSWVEIAPDDNKSFYAAERPKFFETVAGRKLASKTLHRVRVSDLNSGTNYRYRIFSQEVTDIGKNNNIRYGKTVASNVYSQKPFLFKTYADTGTNASFLVLNDIHGKADFMMDLCKDVDFKKLDFVMLNGDMSNSVESEDQIFKDYIDASVKMYASETPIMYNRGNHETRGAFADNLIDYFPTQDGKFYQLYKIGNICFLVLDCGEDKPDSDIEYSGLADYDAYREKEALWLKKIVETEEFRNASARIVFLHIPPPVGEWHGNVELRRLFMPILETADIDVMFSGHTHKYSFHPAGSKAPFPLIVNDNASYAKCEITQDKITIRLVGLDGKNVRTHEFDTKKQK